jgi:hypothetical protein
MGALGARVVRVYTILRPAFYDALAAYDRRHPRAPLRFIQGVWIPEERFLATGDAFDPEVTSGFESEMADPYAAYLRDLRAHHAGHRAGARAAGDQRRRLRLPARAPPRLHAAEDPVRRQRRVFVPRGDTIVTRHAAIRLAVSPGGRAKPYRWRGRNRVRRAFRAAAR